MDLFSSREWIVRNTMDRNIAARRIQRAFRQWRYDNWDPECDPYDTYDGGDNARRDYYERQNYEMFMPYWKRNWLV